MDVNYAHALALLIVRRREEQPPNQAHPDEQDRCRRAPRQDEGGQAQEAAGVGETMHDRRVYIASPARRKARLRGAVSTPEMTPSGRKMPLRGTSLYSR